MVAGVKARFLFLVDSFRLEKSCENIADETTVWTRESLSCVAPHSMGRWDKAVAARTDNDITDDATGLARIEMAAASKARKQAEEAERGRRMQR